MAAVSAPQAANALTPPSSSHGNQNTWDYSIPGHAQMPKQPAKPQRIIESQIDVERGAVVAHLNGAPNHLESSRQPTDTFTSTQPFTPQPHKSNQGVEPPYLAPARVSALNRKDSNPSDSGSAQDSLLDLYGPNSANRSGVNSMDFGDRTEANMDSFKDDEDPENSRWIHRDKLARIESQELQAAGIVLPRTRAHSKTGRRERSRDQQSNGLGRSEQQQKRQRIDSLPTEEVEDNQNMGWDLRLPEEVAQDSNGGSREHGSGQKGMSRIPVFKSSPSPIPLDYLERDTPTQRTRSNGMIGEEDGISYPKTRAQIENVKHSDDATATPTPPKRMQPDTSPKKSTIPAARKGSVPTIRAPSGQTRPKTRSGSKDTSNSRPPTRSGEAGPSSAAKRPEGDPPWLVNTYKPDPRLPPDQQLLPTVARRLQQEQWEKEGKFGNAYDKEFRPLNDEPFNPPDASPQTLEAPEQKQEQHPEWPLRTPKSPSPTSARPGTAGGYSTIPKIQEMPPSPLSPKAPTPQPLNVQEPVEEDTQKRGCGCCIVM